MKLLVKKGNQLHEVKDLSLFDLMDLNYGDLKLMEEVAIAKCYRNAMRELDVNIATFVDTVNECYLSWEGHEDKYTIADALEELIREKGKKVININTRELNCMLCDYLPC